jgi:hypothetical protein
VGEGFLRARPRARDVVPPTLPDRFALRVDVARLLAEPAAFRAGLRVRVLLALRAAGFRAADRLRVPRAFADFPDARFATGDSSLTWAPSIHCFAGS